MLLFKGKAAVRTYLEPMMLTLIGRKIFQHYREPKDGLLALGKVFLLKAQNEFFTYNAACYRRLMRRDPGDFRT